MKAQTRRGGGAGVCWPEIRPDEGEPSESRNGPCGRLIPFTTATSQELQDCTHSKPHDFKGEREGGDDANGREKTGGFSGGLA